MLKPVQSARAAVQVEPFIVSRDFPAARELVWQAWTSPEALARWWCPQGFEMCIASFELRPGGLFHYALTSLHGSKLWGLFAYQEIVPAERLHFTASFSNEQRGTVRHPFSPEWPVEILSTVLLQTVEGGTRLTFRGVPHHATAAEHLAFARGYPGMSKGWNRTLDQLSHFLTETAGI